MAKFELGQWVVDKTKGLSLEICGIITESIGPLYVVAEIGCTNYYITEEGNLMEIDKYYDWG